jgi:DNA-binding transcriptional regulator YiaG
VGFDAFTMDDYQITYDGRIINKKWGREVKPQKNGKGYLRVGIAGKLRFVHRLVAEKFVPNPDNLPQVNHKDGNKLNNCAENLEWVSNQDNRDHAVKNDLVVHGERCPWAKLTLADVRFIREHPEMTITDLANKFCVSRKTVRSVRHGKSWKLD